MLYVEGDLWGQAMLAPQLMQGTGEGVHRGKAEEHGHRSEAGSHHESDVPGWGLCCLIFSQLQGSEGTSMPPLDSKAPLLPFTAKAPVSHLDTWGERQIGIGEGQGGYIAGDNDWLCLPTGLQVG